MLHTEWVPQYLRVVEAHMGDELEFLLLGRIYQVCTVTESPLFERENSIYSKDAIKKLDDLLPPASLDDESEDSSVERQRILILLYKVCCTSPYRVGLEFICDLDLMEKIGKEKDKDDSRRQADMGAMNKITQTFASDLHHLHPISKLRGINAHRETLSVLPDLEKITVDYADDLVMTVDELLNPVGDYCTTESWLNSRTRICATIEIIRRLGELGQPDLIIQCQDSLNAHSEMLFEQTG